MQENWQTFFLGLLQGICEFLPISSSGHLIFFKFIFGTVHGFTLVLLVHLATLCSILTVMNKPIVQIIKLFILDIKNKHYGSGVNIFSKVFVGSLPAGFIGIVFKDTLIYFFDSPAIVGCGFLFTAFLLLATHFFQSSQETLSINTHKMISALSQISYKQAMIIGCFQALAIVPGISRSGSTLAGGFFLRLNISAAFYFSFFLAIPTILGATLLQFSFEGPFLSFHTLFILFLPAYLMGCLSLWLLLKITLKGHLKYFSIYLCFMAVMMFLVS